MYEIFKNKEKNNKVLFQKYKNQRRKKHTIINH